MGVKDQITTTTSTSSATKDDIAKVGVGQGELYSPVYAIKLKEEERDHQEKMIMRIRNLGMIKERVLEKLAGAAVPAEALENARHFFESVIRDVTVAAQGLTKDALLRIKTHLADFLPTLSPSVTRKMVDDAEEEANIPRESGEVEGTEEINRPSPISRL